MAGVSELRGLPEAELRQRLAQTRQELVTLRLKAKQGALEQPHRIRQMRRDIARMLTTLHEQVKGPRAS
ncbi:MAG: 50S ribosomal protein L29 [Candidatus Omnitrophica bacterium]|nr:50S ribosomal protein L29 [Candidatus Omnitrophota bacterium]